MHSALSSFDRPPVIEVVLGVQFEPLQLTTPHLGLLWQYYGANLFRIEEKPSLDRAIERFGVAPRIFAPEIRLTTEASANRIWLVNEEGDEVIQVQRDRFTFNWRKVGESAAYPRYELVEQRFLSALGRFSDFLNKYGLGEVVPTQCEVTYVNHLLPEPGVWESHGDVGRAVSLVSNLTRKFLPSPEDIRAVARFRISDAGGVPVGRLHVRVEPRLSAGDSKAIILLQLTARGAPLGAGLSGMKSFFRLGREWIVKAFLDVTTEEMQKAWGKR